MKYQLKTSRSKILVISFVITSLFLTFTFCSEDPITSIPVDNDIHLISEKPDLPEISDVTGLLNIAASCSRDDVQTAVDTAFAGDTVFVPEGNCTWSESVLIQKPLTIAGAGSDKTILTASGSLPLGFFSIQNISSSMLVRISGFYFDLVDWNAQYGINIGNVSIDNLRIDHCVFNQGGVAQILVRGCKGVIDKNYFYNGNKAISFSAGSSEQANASWNSMEAGTGDALFIEDNEFIDNAEYTASFGNERIGTYNGGKLVVRYNHFDSYDYPLSTTVDPIMTHGSAAAGIANGYWQQGTGARRGQSVVEIYNNIMEGKRIDYPAIVRGSANLIYNNSVILSAGNAPRIQLREEEYYEPQWNPLRTEWPAEDQVHNTFIWNNTINGSQMDATNILAENHIEENRDYFLHEPQSAGGRAVFTGAKGASGSYPTDGNTYPTLGTMVFEPTGPNAYYLYQPYTYPHPLTGSPPTTGITDELSQYP